VLDKQRKHPATRDLWPERRKLIGVFSSKRSLHAYIRTMTVCYYTLQTPLQLCVPKPNRWLSKYVIDEGKVQTTSSPLFAVGHQYPSGKEGAIKYR
jgi:hypothetical protein